MTRVIVGMETDEIALENTEQELFSDRENSVDLRGWERSVQEETNLDILLGVADFLTEHGG